ncbi:MAG: MerR family transcriptional regulator [Sporomusaceae bacterium]|nr:MerR family transcriptional regulator [Sporomusaceae bacterium]
MPYTIKEAAEKLELTAYTLRYYEKAGLLPDLHRNAQGNRVFTEKDLEWLTLIRCLRSTGMPVQEIKRYVELYRQGDATTEVRRQIIVDHKEAVEEKISHMNTCLIRIKQKLAYYDEVVAGSSNGICCKLGAKNGWTNQH